MKLYTKKIFLISLIAGTFFSSVKATNDNSYSVVKEKVRKVTKERGKVAGVAVVAVVGIAIAIATAVVVVAGAVIKKPEGRIMAGLGVAAGVAARSVVEQGLGVVGVVVGVVGVVVGVKGVEFLGYYLKGAVGFLGAVGLAVIIVRAVVVVGEGGGLVGVAVGEMVKGKESNKERIVALVGVAITMVVTIGVVVARVILDYLKITATIGIIKTMVVTIGTIAIIAIIATIVAVEELRRLEETKGASYLVRFIEGIKSVLIPSASFCNDLLSIGMRMGLI